MYGPTVRQSIRSRGIRGVASSTSKLTPRSIAPWVAYRTPKLNGVRGYSDQPSHPLDPSKANPSTSTGPESSQRADAGDFASRYAEESSPIGPRSRLGYIFTALLLGGLGMTIYGIGELWGSMTMWPKDVRNDLRQGLRESMREERGIAVQYLTRAWETAKKMKLEEFGLQPYMKTTGIAITLAAVLEADGKHEQAYQVYQEALSQLQEGAGDSASRLRTGLSAPERMRGVALAYRLGELAEQLHKPAEEEEKWLVHSVETTLRDIMHASSKKDVSIERETPEGKVEASGMVEHLKLPMWATSHDLAAPFEALGSFYSKTGKISYAMPLYLQAISILIPPPPQVTSADDQCRAAQLMGNIAELILRTSMDSASVEQAESWANKGLEVASRVRKSTFRTHPVCEHAYAMMLYNLAMIRDMSGDQDRARQLFVESMHQARSIGLKEAVKKAEKAIGELGRGAEVPSVLTKNK